MTSGGLDSVARVIVGVDTHLDEHVAVAIDHHGARLGEYRLATTAEGYENLESWAIGLGEVSTFGVEGTGSYGAGLARYLAQCGHTVIEVNRPDRSTTLSTLKWPHDLFLLGWLGSLPSQVWTRWR